MKEVNGFNTCGELARCMKTTYYKIGSINIIGHTSDGYGATGVIE